MKLCDDPAIKHGRFLSRMIACWKCDEGVHDKDMREFYSVNRETGKESGHKIGHSWCGPDLTPEEHAKEQPRASDMEG